MYFYLISDILYYCTHVLVLTFLVFFVSLKLPCNFSLAQFKCFIQYNSCILYFGIICSIFLDVGQTQEVFYILPQNLPYVFT